MRTFIGLLIVGWLNAALIRKPNTCAQTVAVDTGYRTLSKRFSRKAAEQKLLKQCRTYRRLILPAQERTILRHNLKRVVDSMGGCLIKPRDENDNVLHLIEGFIIKTKQNFIVEAFPRPKDMAFGGGRTRKANSLQRCFEHFKDEFNLATINAQVGTPGKKLC